MHWHNLDIDAIFRQTGSSPAGLSSRTAEQKYMELGPNQLEDKKKKPAWLLLLNQFKDFMILVLVIAAIISGVAGDLTDTIIILVIVGLNAVLGFVQEYRAEKAMDALKKLASPQTTVLRNGQPMHIDSRFLVPGDVVLLEAGNMVSADLRLFECHGLRVEESALTGESSPVDKHTDVLSDADLPLGDRLNLAFKGTLVVAGRGAGVVVATGMHTEIGRIARLLQDDEQMTPLQLRMTDFGKKLSYLILLICLILFVVGWLRGEEPLKMLLVAISLAVAAIPEALPALITIALARGASRLARKHALIRKLPAVETLGSVTYICSDKTGTLTQNRMQVVHQDFYPADLILDKHLSALEAAMALNHDVKKSEAGAWLGDPTEVALVEYVAAHHAEHHLQHVMQEFPRVAELPFDSDRKCMTTVHRYGERYLVVSKGAAESIVAALGEEQVLRDDVLRRASFLAAGGLRVLVYAYRVIDRMPEPFTYEAVEREMRYLGFAGMMDPPRETVAEAIRECRTAGIRPVMITGDHPETAAAIAREIGILETDDLVVTGRELQSMTPEELGEKVERIAVYARVSPEQKLNIVRALQRRGHFVAMTGDGVNDAPSLKASNIGVAMGINGTDVSKEAAHMILLDDDFATIVRAVKEGRRIYDNIRRFVKYIMTCNGAEIWTIFLAPLLGLPIPLLPIHILWINLVTDGLPGLALSAEKAENNIMKRPPRKTGESLFAEGIGYHIVWVGLLMAFITLGTQAWSLYQVNTHWQTMVFTVLSLSQLGHVLAIRSDHEFIYKKGLFSNRPLLGAVALTFLLQLVVIYLPVANRIFKTQPLTLMELLLCIGLSAVVFHAVELEKWIKVIRRKKSI